MTKDTLVNHSNENSVKLKKKKKYLEKKKENSTFPSGAADVKTFSLDGPVSVMSNGGTNCN